MALPTVCESKAVDGAHADTEQHPESPKPALADVSRAALGVICGVSLDADGALVRLCRTPVMSAPRTRGGWEDLAVLPDCDEHLPWAALGVPPRYLDGPVELPR